MDFNSPAGFIAVLLMMLSFYVTTYAVIALNVGWRFAYWLSSACFGAIMVLLSIFWVINPVGPRGTDPIWVAIGAGTEIGQVTVDEATLTTPAQYPGGSWAAPEEGDTEQSDALSSAIAGCLTTAEEALNEVEKEACIAAQALMPPDEDIPIIDGTEVAVTPEVSNIRFATEGSLLGQAIISPVTHDPRVATDDPVKGKQLGPSFRLLALFESGSVLIPPIASLIIFGLYTGFHLLGLQRAEKRKLSPAVT